MNIKRIISSVGIGAGAIIIGLGVQYAMANWIPAPGSPPNCSDPTIPGCNAPINVGTSAQAKNGSLSLGTSVATTSVSLDVEGKLSWLTGLIDNGPFQLIDAGALAGQDNGKVLTSDANGNAAWRVGEGGAVVIGGVATSSVGTTTATFSLPTGNWTLDVISTTFQCQIAPASLKLDGHVIGSYYGSYKGDTQGCNELTIHGIANNISSGSHTFTYYFDPYIDQTWPNGHGAQISWTAYEQ